MAYAISSAFKDFMKDQVNLDSEASKDGKRSRNWLVDNQILNFPDKYDDFPILQQSPKMWFGSFSRKTKIRELDDIDMMILMHAQGSSYSEYGDTIMLTAGADSKFNNFLDDTKLWINSRRVVNRFVSALQNVPQYSSAVSKRQGEAATLKLSSYTWNFDIVPAFSTVPDDQGNKFFLIPDGNGHWKKTDPRIDKDRTTSINQKHGGKVLNIIRLIKYWKKKRGVPAIGSYLLETIMLNRYDSLFEDGMSEYIPHEFPHALRSLADAILGPVYDQKNFQGDINGLEWGDQWKIRELALEDAVKAEQASSQEFLDPEKAGEIWKEIFGKNFPGADD
ncbi:nucleotidyltransferase [Pantoea sp. BS_8]|uniref:nucleotidyltransferase n=1 Tax=Pantoea sp. BS_8 TaxID=3055781 RepID=UPI0035C164B2